jgi:hypothetical protein
MGHLWRRCYHGDDVIRQLTLVKISMDNDFHFKYLTLST